MEQRQSVAATASTAAAAASAATSAAASAAPATETSAVVPGVRKSAALVAEGRLPLLLLLELLLLRR